MQEFTLYSYFRSSTSYRVRIALNLKEASYEYRAINIVEIDSAQQEELFRVNPHGRIPCLIHQGRPVTQSMAIIGYLDDILPEPRLFPQEPLERAVVLSVCEAINSDIAPLHNIDVVRELGRWFGADRKAQSDWAAHWITEGFESLEETLRTSAGAYSFGNQVSAADLFVVPEVNRANRFHVDMKNFPTLERINKNCLELKAFQQAAPESQPDTPLYLRQEMQKEHKSE